MFGVVMLHSCPLISFLSDADIISCLLLGILAVDNQFLEILTLRSQFEVKDLSSLSNFLLIHHGAIAGSESLY